MGVSDDSQTSRRPSPSVSCTSVLNTIALYDTQSESSPFGVTCTEADVASAASGRFSWVGLSHLGPAVLANGLVGDELAREEQFLRKVGTPVADEVGQSGARSRRRVVEPPDRLLHRGEGGLGEAAVVNHHRSQGPRRVPEDHDEAGADRPRPRMAADLGEAFIAVAKRDPMVGKFEGVRAIDGVLSIGANRQEAQDVGPVSDQPAAAGPPDAPARSRGQIPVERLGDRPRTRTKVVSVEARVIDARPLFDFCRLHVEEGGKDVDASRDAAHHDVLARDAVHASSPQARAAHGVVAGDEVVLEEAQGIGRLSQCGCAVLKEEGGDNG